MKKLGTPIAAAPGSAWEIVGLAAVGTPLPWRMVVASGLPSALSFLDWASSPVAFLRSALPTVFCACWPPAEAEGVLSVDPGTDSVAGVALLASPGVAVDGAGVAAVPGSAAG